MLKAIITSDAETVLAEYRKHRSEIVKSALVGASSNGSLAAAATPKSNDQDPKTDLSLTEVQMNHLGYQLLRLKRVKDAIEVFKQNTVDFPEAFNTWDSLAEGLMVSGEKDLAIKYYKKSLELDPSNTNAVQKLKELGGVLAQTP